MKTKIETKSHPAEPMNLSRARCGERLRIVGLCQSATACRLRELGFCEMAEVCKLADNGALICNLLGTRVAIARDLGRQIFVEKVGA